MDSLEEAISGRMRKRIGLVVYVSGNPLGSLTESGQAPPDATPRDVEEAIKPFDDVTPEFAGMLVPHVEVPTSGAGEWPNPVEKGYGVRVELDSERLVDLGDLREAANMIEGRIDAASDATPSGADPDVALLSPTNL